MQIVVEKDFDLVRLDRFLASRLNLTHSIICKLIRRRKIAVNGAKVKDSNVRVKEKDVVEINNILSVEKPEQKEYFVSDKIVKNIKKRIKYEDENLAIIDKPAGLATQSGGSLKYSLDEISRIIWPNSAKIVHRLDKDTSGLIIIAKNRLTAMAISSAFQSGHVQKTYLAVLSPIPENKNGTITTNITNAETQGKMHKCKNTENGEGKLAITDYKIIKTDKNLNIALAEFSPKTGRTHQIRLHASSIGCPIVGDFKYHGNCDLSKDLHLVAYKIDIPDITPKQKIFASIPDFFIYKQ